MKIYETWHHPIFIWSSVRGTRTQSDKQIAHNKDISHIMINLTFFAFGTPRKKLKFFLSECLTQHHLLNASRVYAIVKRTLQQNYVQLLYTYSDMHRIQ